MGKYSKAEVQKRAQLYVSAEKRMDTRCTSLLMILSLKTGLDPDECRRRIHMLAQGKSY